MTKYSEYRSWSHTCWGRLLWRRRWPSLWMLQPLVECPGPPWWEDWGPWSSLEITATNQVKNIQCLQLKLLHLSGARSPNHTDRIWMQIHQKKKKRICHFLIMYLNLCWSGKRQIKTVFSVFSVFVKQKSLKSSQSHWNVNENTGKVQVLHYTKPNLFFKNYHKKNDWEQKVLLL